MRWLQRIAVVSVGDTSDLALVPEPLDHNLPVGALVQVILGMQCVHDGSLAGSPGRLARLADLLVDPRWSYQFKLVKVGYIPTMEREPTFPGQVARGHLRAAAFKALSSPSASNVSLSISKMEGANHAYVYVQVGRDIVPAGAMQRAISRWRVPAEATAEAAAASWVELQHQIIETLGASNGVLVTATNSYVMNAETWLSVTSLDGKLMHHDPEEIRSYEVNHYRLGKQYIRKPRWGTYLSPAHVEAVGGRDKILAVVKPPVVRDVGELLYVQLSERVADATAPETRERWRAFAELVAPITMPLLQP